MTSPHNEHVACSPLATPTATRDVLERHGFNLKKSLGQNFLVNDAIVKKIVALADVQRTDCICEIGPGIGTLTCALLAQGAHVISIERDPALPAILADTLSCYTGQFDLIEKDALEVSEADLTQFGWVPHKLVANLPYAVAATVVLDYFERFSFLESMTVMVQREVAERMMAQPGSKNYGAYTVKLALYARASGSFFVAPSNFMPPPHVESCVIRLERDKGALREAEKHAACTMADASFFARRKTIANSLKQYFAGRDARIVAHAADLLEAVGIDPKVRGETLVPEDFVRLGKAYAALTERLSEERS